MTISHSLEKSVLNTSEENTHRRTNYIPATTSKFVKILT